MRGNSLCCPCYENMNDKNLRKKIWDIMIAAMHKRTKIGCESLVQDAIDKCTVPSIQNYIRRNYIRNTQQWALWARQHSPLLLQVTSTNPLESYHSELKRSSSPKYGLIGIYSFLFLTIFYSFILLMPYISTFNYLFSLFIHTLSGHSFVRVQYPSDPFIHFIFFIFYFIFHFDSFINFIPRL